MARGDRREPIVKDDPDRDAFAALLEELVGRTGFEFFSWVLMGNHYHLVFKTPEPNLVEGMKWPQNTWTKRFNARHRLGGHVFGGRYKAVVVVGAVAKRVADPLQAAGGLVVGGVVVHLPIAGV